VNSSKYIFKKPLHTLFNKKSYLSIFLSIDFVNSTFKQPAKMTRKSRGATTPLANFSPVRYIHFYRKKYPANSNLWIQNTQKPMKATRFGLIRHSRTLWNEEKRIQGLQNSPLSESGCLMAMAWGKELQQFHWDRIMASDLGRVQETVALVNGQLQLPVHTEPLLREQDWGAWSGLTFPRLFARFPDQVREQEDAGWNFRPPGGESRKEVLARAVQALRRGTEQWPGQDILVVCHEGIIKTLLYHLLDRKFLPDEPKILKGYQLHLLSFSHDRPVLTAMNHLCLSNSRP
jgi:probable phosphoglycerate mutase